MPWFSMKTPSSIYFARAIFEKKLFEKYLVLFSQLHDEARVVVEASDGTFVSTVEEDSTVLALVVLALLVVEVGVIDQHPLLEGLATKLDLAVVVDQLVIVDRLIAGTMNEKRQ